MSNAIDSVFTLRPATIEDTPTILHCIEELAAYERIDDQCVATDALLKASLFGPDPVAEVTLGFSGDDVAGFALWFRSFSTLLSRPGIYLEDLFVFEQFRGRGLGRLFLSSLARTAVERGYGRVEWAVLTWNTNALAFYDSIGAAPLRDWTTYRLTGDAMASLTGGEAGPRK